MAKRVTTESYRKDPLYPRLTKAVAAVLNTGNVVSPVDVLIRMDLLKAEQLKDWRHGRIPYLERVILGNLSRLSRLLRILRLHAHDLGLKPSVTVYMKWGKGAKHKLRFTKTRDPHLEEAYSQHFVRPGSEHSHPPPNAKAPGRKVDAAAGSNPVAEQPGGATPTPADDRAGPLTTDVGHTGSSPAPGHQAGQRPRGRTRPLQGTVSPQSAAPDGGVALLRAELAEIKRKYQGEGARIDSADQAMVRGADDLARFAKDAVSMLTEHIREVTSLRVKLERQPPGTAVALLEAQLGAEALELQLKLGRQTRLEEIASTPRTAADLGILEATSAAARIQHYRYGRGLVARVKRFYELVTAAIVRALAEPGGATTDLGHVLLTLQGLRRRTHACGWDEGPQQEIAAIERSFLEDMAKLSGHEGALLGQTAIQFWKLGESKGTPAGQALLVQLETGIEELSRSRPEWRKSLTDALALFITELRGSP